VNRGGKRPKKKNQKPIKIKTTTHREQTRKEHDPIGESLPSNPKNGKRVGQKRDTGRAERGTKGKKKIIENKQKTKLIKRREYGEVSGGAWRKPEREVSDKIKKK